MNEERICNKKCMPKDSTWGPVRDTSTVAGHGTLPLTPLINFK